MLAASGYAAPACEPLSVLARRNDHETVGASCQNGKGWVPGRDGREGVGAGTG
jgi:hypothetical protein